MAKANTKKLLKEMLKEIDDMYARGQIDSFRQLVTLEKENIIKAWKEGYSNLIAARPETTFPDINEIDWNKGVTNSWEAIKNNIDANGGFISEYTNNTIVFKESSKTKKIFDGIKNFNVNFIQDNLADYTLTDAATEKKKNPSLNFTVAAGQSDIGIIKKATHRLHKGGTSVGMGRLALSLKWIEKTRFFNTFTSSKQAEGLKDVYGDISGSFITKGTKKKGLILTPNEDIKIFLEAASNNPRGGEITDWSGKDNIGSKLRAALLSWAKNKELEGRKGSKSIENNAVDIVEYNIISALQKIKRAKVQRKVEKSNRNSSKVTQINKKKKSSAVKKSATAKIMPVRRVTNKGASSVPLQLIALINKDLPRVVAKNMQSPALNYRTGRFASSVRVTDVVTTPKGFPSIGYTYDKSRYQTFEPGFAQGSVERDPRRLIDKSMREIAAQYAIGRFFTRRV